MGLSGKIQPQSTRRGSTRNWTQAKRDRFACAYPTTVNAKLMERFKISYQQLVWLRRKMKLKKSPKLKQRSSQSGWFTKGNQSSNTRPMGFRKMRDGVLLEKVSSLGTERQNWRPVHRLIWERERGPIPAGFLVIFINKDVFDLRVENLELISPGDLSRRDEYLSYPREVRELIVLNHMIQRAAKERAREKSNGRRAKPSNCNFGRTARS